MKLDYFNKRIKTKQEVKTSNKVWVYTRVSSIGQYNLNGSLDTQLEVSRQYAINNNLNVVNTFGGTYESAKDDFTREEFKRLIENIRKAKEKPLAILVYKINRFSRSGGGGIGLLHELVNQYGVHLIETISGKSTFTERGFLEILDLLRKAKEDNLDRLDITIPGMKKTLKNGNKVGSTPRGYDHYGPKVKDLRFISRNQEIKINDEGKILRQAWILKKTGTPDYIIIKELESLGMKITKQRLSKMWRNPFYCGILVNSLIEVAVKGNWEPLVSVQDFMYINDILDGKGQTGYKQVKIDENRPLQGCLYCGVCGGKMTGYKVSKKNIHYYKCQTNGCTCKDLNALTGQKTITKGLNLLFEELLETITLKKEFIPLFIKQVRSILEMSEIHKVEKRNKIESEIKKHESLIISVEDKFINDLIDPELYQRKKNEINEILNDLRQKREKLNIDLSNLNSKLEKAVEILGNISKIWSSGSIGVKQKIQNLIFPDGIFISPKNREYRTSNIQVIFQLILDLTRDSEGQKKDSPINLTDESSLVAGTGLEPVTFGL